MKRIAVEDSLSNVKDYLQEKGYTVESLEDSRDRINSFDAVVVSGQNSNFLGIQDTSTKGNVVNAKGLTAKDIHREIQKAMKR